MIAKPCVEPEGTESSLLKNKKIKKLEYQLFLDLKESIYCMGKEKMMVRKRKRYHKVDKLATVAATERVGKHVWIFIN